MDKQYMGKGYCAKKGIETYYNSKGIHFLRVNLENK